MRIVIDMQGLQTPSSAPRGVGRYTENIVKALLRNARADDEIVLALNGAFPHSFDPVRATFAGLLSSDRIVTWQQFYDTSGVDCSPVALDLAQKQREHFLNSFDPDIVFSTNLQEGLKDTAVTSVRTIRSDALYASTLHDVVPLSFDGYLNDPRTRQWYFEKIDAARRSDIVVTVSDASRDEIIGRLRLPPGKVLVARNGYDSRVFRKPADTARANAVPRRYGIEAPYLLYVGGADRHKNLARLLKAFALFRVDARERIQLALGGADAREAPELRELTDALNLDQEVVFCGRVAEEDLPALYASCRAFVFPSLAEGFGLPVVEALACGAPVIGSDTPAIAEIIESPDALFDPLDERSIARCIRSVCTRADLRERLVADSDSIGRKYSWDSAARVLLAAFHDAAGTRRRPPMNRRCYATAAASELASLCHELDATSKGLAALSIAESFAVADQRTLFIDVSTVARFDHKTGIQRVTRAIAAVLLKHAESGFHIELVYSVGDGKTFKAANRYMWSAFGALRPAEDRVVSFRGGDVLLFLDLHPGIAIAHRAHVQYLRNKGLQVFHVVYDILPIERPDTFWPELCAEFRLWAETVGRSDGALCISDAVAGQLAGFLGKYGEKRRMPFRVGHFHLGADIENSAPSFGMPETAASVLGALRARPTILMVGTVEPRKAHRQAINAFKLLWASGEDVNLAIVGKMGWGMHDLPAELERMPVYGKRLFWLQGISDEYLTEVYKACAGLLAASEGEGFGLPLIEAAQHGIDIIARDIAVFREVAGSSASYFPDSKDPAALAAALSAWLRDKKTNAVPSSRGLRWLNWTQSADQMLDFIAGGRAPRQVQGAGNVCPGTVYDLHSGKLTWRGFSEPVDDYRWLAKREGGIGFEWAEADDAAQLSVRCRLRGEPRPVLFLNDREVAGTFADAEDQVAVFSLAGLLAGTNVLDIRYASPSAEMANRLREEGVRRAGHSSGAAVPGVGVQSLRWVYLPFLPAGTFLDHRTANCTWEGFSVAEDSFRWTAGNHAAISFRWRQDDSNCTLSILCQSLGKQRTVLRLNGACVYDAVVDGSERTLNCRLPMVRGGFNTIDFHLPDARRPNDMDTRRLALAIRGFEVKSEQPAAPARPGKPFLGSPLQR